MNTLHRLFWIILAGGVLLGIIFTVFFSDFFTVTKLTVDAESNSTTAGSIVPFLEKFRGENILFINTDSASREIEQSFPNEIISAHVRKAYPHRLVAKLEERPPALNAVIVTPEKTQKFVLNSIGYALFENADLPNLPTVTVRLPKTSLPKTIVFSTEKTAAILIAFEKFYEYTGMKASEAEWKKVERELHLKTEKNFFIWIDLTADVSAQLSKLKRALPNLDIFGKPLEYIDLRIAGAENEKVIFKARK